MFNMGGRRWRVRVAEEPIEWQGKRRRGLCVEQEGEVVISPHVKPEDRARVLFHELAHAQIFTSGMPRDIESICDQFAATCTAAFVGLMMHGGLMGLQRLKPGQTLGQGERVMLASPRPCGRCSGHVAPGYIHCSPVNDYPVAAVKMAFECEFCDLPQWRVEAANMAGLPSGVMLDHSLKGEQDAA